MSSLIRYWHTEVQGNHPIPNAFSGRLESLQCMDSHVPMFLLQLRIPRHGDGAYSGHIPTGGDSHCLAYAHDVTRCIARAA
eukprot:6483730-Amphidinium_carterae.2